MEKLELKHLAPYLPYRLMVWNQYSGRKEEMLSCGCSTVECFGRLKTVSDHYDYDEIKPILRPLSDLTKEIDVNGEKLNPTDELFIEFGGGHGNIGNFINTFIQSIIIDPLSNSYQILQKLHEWHFDTQGLIEANLAIDINTIR